MAIPKYDRPEKIGRSGVRWEYRPNDEIRERNETFYGALRNGQIVHVREGSGWIRARSVGDKLQALALVGKWAPRDLPNTRPDGSAHVPYAAGLVLAGGTFRPEYTQIWESEGPSVAKLKAGPKALKPVDFNKLAKKNATKARK